MDNQEIILAFAVLSVLPLAACINWVLSLKFCKTRTLDWHDDSRQLWAESIPFLKTQMIFIALTIAGKSCGMASESIKQSDTGLKLQDLIAQLAQGATYVIEFFYVSHLASTKGVALISTIGIWAVTKLLIAEKALEVLTGLGLVLLLFPGIYLAIRTCLFVPIFAAEGHKVVHSIKRSWSLTKGRYWLASRYLGAVALALAILIFIKGYVVLSTELKWQYLGPIVIAAATTCSAITLGLQLLFQGLSFKLYTHLLSDENQNSLSQPSD